jgi:hypothetical protein
MKTRVRVFVALGVLGSAAALVGGVLFAVSGSDDETDVLRRAFESLSTPVYSETVATVNGEGISGERTQLLLAVHLLSQEAAAVLGPTPASSPPDPTRILNNLIRSEVIYQEAGQLDRQCTDEETKEVAEAQLALADDVARVWANHLDITVKDLSSHPAAEHDYSRVCAGSKLYEEVIGRGPDVDDSGGLQEWNTYVDLLVAGAQIEILEQDLR